MNKKVLIVDDSALMRKAISDIIKKDGMFQVIDTAVNGVEALKILESGEVIYDILLLDIHMPLMGGIELLEHIGHLENKPVVIVISSVAGEGTEVTIRALELGAFDFVTKPSSFIELKSHRFRHELHKLLCHALGESHRITGHGIEQAGSPDREQIIKNVTLQRGSHDKMIVIAASTGGPKALQSVIPRLPAKIDAPVLLVQHMPEGFTASLAARLDELSPVKVREAKDGASLEKSTVYIAKGGHQMRLCLDRNAVYHLSVSKEEARNGLRPCADILFESMIPYSFSSLVCVVLTGMGADGTKGIMQLHNKKNNYIIAQNAETCTVYGMPKAITDKGVVNEVLPLNQIADAITKHVGVR